MSTVTTLSAAEVRNQMLELWVQFRESRKQWEEAAQRCRKIDREIVALRTRCPHENIREDDGWDGMEKKVRTFCTDCNTQLL